MTLARVARRQLLVDRWTEKLERAGIPHAEARARDLLLDLDDLGFTLPAALQEPPPLTGRGADPDHRRSCMEEIRAALAERTQESSSTSSGQTTPQRGTVSAPSDPGSPPA